MAFKTLELVVPLFNEIEVLPRLVEQSIAACQKTGTYWNIIFVDDGSHDGTAECLARHVDRFRESGCEQGELTLIKLSRNFGQQQAILAGLDATVADCVVVMDGDLQDPPDLIPHMIQLWHEGNEVVIPQRTSRQETPIRAFGFWMFHRLFHYLSDLSIPPRTGNFCLLDRIAVDAIGRLKERHRYLPGLRGIVGFQQVMLPFQRPQRAAGAPKQSLSRLTSYAFDAILGFSAKPLKLIACIGAAIVLASFLIGCSIFIAGIAGTISLSNSAFWIAELACLVSGLAGMQLTAIGIVGAYVRRVYDEARDRPAYIIAAVDSSDSDSCDQNSNESRLMPVKAVVDRYAA